METLLILLYANLQEVQTKEYIVTLQSTIADAKGLVSQHVLTIQSFTCN